MLIIKSQQIGKENGLLLNLQLISGKYGIVPTTIPTTFNKWESSKEKSQAYNLKVVGSNPTPTTNYINKMNDLRDPQRLRTLKFFVFNNQKLVKSNKCSSGLFSFT